MTGGQRFLLLAGGVAVMTAALAVVTFALVPAQGSAPEAVADVLVDEPRTVSLAGFEGTGGKPLSAAALTGGWTLVTLGFTSCPDVCPAALARLSGAAAALAEEAGEAPRILFVTVDPRRDTLARLTEYVRYFSDHVEGARGRDDAALARLEDTLGASHRIPEHEPGAYYDVSHSAYAWVVAPDGRVVARLSPPFRVPEVVAVLTGLQGWYRPG